MSKATKNRARGVYLVPLPTLGVNAENLRKSKTGLDDFIHERGLAEFKARPRISHDHPQFKQWDTDDSNGLPDDLLNASMPAAWLDPSQKPPPILWAVDGLIAMKETAVIIGGGGAGKTTFALNLTIGMSLGHDVLNFKIDRPRRVLYCMLERHADGFWRRFHKAVRCLFPKLTPEQRQMLFDNFLPSALAGQPVSLIEHQKNQWSMNRRNVDELIEMMREKRIEVIVFDTLSRLHGANGNDESVASALVKAFERITQATGAAVIVLAHTGKNPRDDIYGMRGSSAWIDNTSGGIYLRLLDEKQREKVNVIGPRDARNDTLIVEMEHRRMSETAKMPPKHFAIKQGGDMDGWMWDVSIAQKHTSSEVPKQEWFRDWYREHGPFTKNAFAIACMEHTGVGRPTAQKTFDEMSSKEVIEATEGKVTSGSTYQLAGPSAGENSKPAAPRPKNRTSKR